MSDLKKNIIGLTLGIRYNRSFRIPDIAGDIIDNILYSSKTPFGTKYFPVVQESSSREKILHNETTKEYLRINTDDLIIGITINNNFEEKFNWLKNDVLKYLQNTLFFDYGIKNIRRLGIIFSHKIAKNQKINNMISTLTGNTILDADNISISFSKKGVATEALYRKSVSDYKNRIYNFRELKEALLVDLDYQYYYDPTPEDLRDCFTEQILDEAKSFLENNFYTWLNKNEA